MRSINKVEVTLDASDMEIIDDVLDRLPVEGEHENISNTFDQQNYKGKRNAFGSFIMANKTGSLQKDLIKNLFLWLKSKNITVEITEDERAALKF
jgi:hypothetical protein